MSEEKQRRKTALDSRTSDPLLSDLFSLTFAPDEMDGTHIPGTAGMDICRSGPAQYPHQCAEIAAAEGTVLRRTAYRLQQLPHF